MGKVYDALQRAEQQRAQRRGDAGQAPGVPSELGAPSLPASERRLEEMAASAPLPKEKGKPFWARWSRGRRAEQEDSTNELNRRRVALLQPDSFVAEQFRTLRARIDSLASSQPVHTIAVTSALPGDGKTMAAISLAVVSAMNVGQKVLLVDCDLRHPHVGKSLGLQIDAGLVEVLKDGVEVGKAITRIEGTDLDVLPVRNVAANPSELLASTAMVQLMEELAGSFDRVILDLPPTLGLPDAKIITGICDGILFVVRAGETPSEEVNAALEVLDRRRILGLVLNGTTAGAAPRYGYR